MKYYFHPFCCSAESTDEFLDFDSENSKEIHGYFLKKHLICLFSFMKQKLLQLSVSENVFKYVYSVINISCLSIG